MAKDADISSKRLIGFAPEEWVRLAVGLDDVRDCVIVSSDFQTLSRASDTQVRVTSPEHGDFLVLFEIQLRYPVDMPLRLRAYTGLAEEKYRLPVYPVLINVLPVGQHVVIPNFFENTFLGLTARQEYRVINLWEMSVETLLESDALTLFPLAPVFRGGRNEAVLETVLQRLRNSPVFANDSRRGDLETALAIFAGYVFDQDSLLDFARKRMDVFTESPFYQWIVKQGLQQGLQQGVLQGMQLEREALLGRQLRHKFVTLPDKTWLAVQSLTLTQAEAFAEALLDFQSLEDLQAWLNTHIAPANGEFV